MRSNANSPYMRWAKLSSAAKHNLATSGVASYPIAKLGDLNGLEINGSNSYGYAPLVEAIASRFGVPPECVFTTAGTAMANHLALAATTAPGDEILVEQPTYELLLSTANYLGLKIRRFQRPFTAKFQPDLDDLARSIGPSTKMIVLTNMHNPTGVLMSNETVQRVGKLAGKVGARVVVDEVYLEMLYDARPQTAFLLDPERFVVTSSLTKAYGLSGLRCGWVFATKELVQRMWAINDLYSATPVFLGEQLSVLAFGILDRIRQEMKQMLAANRKLLSDFYASQRDLEVVLPEHGTVSFPRLMNGSVEDLLELLRQEFETSAVPGSFFEMPQHFRVGVGGNTADVRTALQQLARGLDSFAQRK
jgi:aspartate/methionine/tyrosine aminotransferase